MRPGAEQLTLNAVLRRDFPSFLRKVFHTLSPGQHFVPGWHIGAVAHRLEQVRRGEIRRLIINLPPRSLKSIAASVAFPAFVLGHDPTRRIICVSYSADLAHKLSNDFRAVLGSRWYRAIFPGTKIGLYKDSEGEIELTRRGLRLATSVGGTLTGRGGDIIVVDDPLKPIDALSEPKRSAANQWFANTLLSRLDDKRAGAILIVMQRGCTWMTSPALCWASPTIGRCSAYRRSRKASRRSCYPEAGCMNAGQARCCPRNASRSQCWSRSGRNSGRICSRPSISKRPYRPAAP